MKQTLKKGINYDYSKLRAIIDDRFDSPKLLAASIGMSERCMKSRLDGMTNFKASEIQVISDSLELSDDDVQECFFRQKESLSDEAAAAFKLLSREAKILLIKHLYALVGDDSAPGKQPSLI